jgi:CheY-like chemotaxis protein
MPSRTPTPLSDLLPETAALALSGSNVRAQFSVPDDLWPADADSAQIGQVIQNLALNAAQAMPDGGTVELRARNLTLTGQDPLPLPPGRYVQVSVTDHGVGIPEENLPRIFLPYFTTKESGSGLGLAISYSIVKKHDGHITVESAPGVGTTVHVYLPASERGPASAPEPPPRKVRACKKVLLMDDEELVRKGAAWLLRDAGYEVECAREGAEAVELYREALEANRPFDAVVLDLTVPGGVGGEECMRQLRALDPRVRAIVCSGYSDEPVVADFRQYGFRGVVTKPFTLDDLLAALEGAVAGGEEEGP